MALFVVYPKRMEIARKVADGGVSSVSDPQGILFNIELTPTGRRKRNICVTKDLCISTQLHRIETVKITKKKSWFKKARPVVTVS